MGSTDVGGTDVPPLPSATEAESAQGGAGGVTGDDASDPNPLGGSAGLDAGLSNGIAGDASLGSDDSDGELDASGAQSADAAPPVSVGLAGEVACGAQGCALQDNGLCCFVADEAQGYCSDQGVCQGNDGIFQCDELSDCAEGLCCFEAQTNGTDRATCGGACPSESSDTMRRVQLCLPDRSECETGSCQATTLDGHLPPGFFACL